VSLDPVAKKQALAAAALDGAEFLVEEYISRFPTLDADGFPIETDPYLDEQAEFLLGRIEDAK
jgi:hypothetical protein